MKYINIIQFDCKLEVFLNVIMVLRPETE